MVEDITISVSDNEEDPPQDLSDSALSAAEATLSTKIDNFQQETEATQAAVLLQQLKKD